MTPIPRICFFGPESTGKTTLSQALGTHFSCPVIPEYGRIYSEKYDPEVWAKEDFLKIAWGHIALRHVAERTAPKLIIEDTDPVATAVWSDQLGVSRDPWFAQYHETADLYLLMDIDLPWVDDGVRYWPDEARREAFKQACVQELEQRDLTYVLLSGDWDARQAKAIAEAQKFLTRKGIDLSV